MHIRTIARTVAATGTLAAALCFMTPALAADIPGADMANTPMPAPPPLPDAPPPPRLPDTRPVWTGDPLPPGPPIPAVLQVDPRVRDIWLAECRRRMDIYYGGGWDDGYGWKRHRRRNDVRTMGYDYCEVYFDDYYRHYSMAGHGHGMMMHTMTRPAPAAQNCVEEERVSYVPVRTRHIPRRIIRDKRVPDKRIRIR